MGLSLSKGYTFSEVMLGMVGEKDLGLSVQDSFLRDFSLHHSCDGFRVWVKRGSADVQYMYSVLVQA